MTTSEVDQELERLFAVARAATAPDADARERVRAGVAPRLTAEATESSAGIRPRLWLGLGAVVVGVGAVALWLSRAPSVSSASTSALVPARPAISATPVAPVAPPPALPAPLSLPTPSVLAAPSAPLVVDNKPAPSARAAPADELPLVRAMQLALRAGHSSEALALAADHARRFPRGTLVEEREGVRAVAQCRLAAPAARSAILDNFTRRFATSPYAGRVKAACQ